MGRVVLVFATNSATSSGLGGGTSGFVVDMASRTPARCEIGPRWGRLGWFKRVGEFLVNLNRLPSVGPTRRSSR
jgi:hypothetical protein